MLSPRKDHTITIVYEKALRIGASSGDNKGEQD